MTKHQRVATIIAAAGKGERMGGVDKIMALLAGKSVLVRATDIFQRCDIIDQIVIVVSERNLERCRKLVIEQGWSKVTGVYPGGERRQDSVRIGLGRLEGCDWVLIHDGARPLVPRGLIERGLEVAKESGAAVAAVPVTDTIKMASDDKVVRQTLLRQNLWEVQTPQIFRFDIINTAHYQVKDKVTDDASLVEQSGCTVKLFVGSYDNIKITTPRDLALAEWILNHK